MAAMKKFLIIGNQNAITFKEIFPLIKDNKLWLGVSIHSGDREFKVPDSYPLEAAGYRVDNDGVKYIRVKGVRWFTNIDNKQRYETLDLYKHYTPEEYPKYDNYDAINIDKTSDIPMDYDDVMGVPITFLDKYCPSQFEIIGISNHFEMAGIPYSDNNCYCEINGIRKYVRFFIQKKQINYENMKKFLIIGNMNAITFKEIFPYIKNDELWLGVSITSGGRAFNVPDDYPLEAATCGVDNNGKRFIRVKGVRWFTNVDNKKRNTPLDLYKTYIGHKNEYPKYDNYDAINVDKTADIPMDYEGVMGVPITFLDKYCPEQFEIIGMMSGAKGTGLTNGNDGRAKFYVNGKGVYARILIKRKLCCKT